ncbi:MAG: CYTH domain-containing protein [Candidatus Cloacimonetes bacterium]|nr:CYTH domain-containing protein [Candidatus Cloacimonadota bacterium]
MLNIEIKARCDDLDFIRKILKQKKAIYKGLDHQIDTYFKVKNGRMKMREGNIEYSLVHYNREDISGPKRSEVLYYHPRKTDPIKEQLDKAVGTLVIVDKKRDIYFIENTKFHLDKVKGLGSFVEIEAIDSKGNIGSDKLYQQCNEYLKLFKIKANNLIDLSYSDLLLKNKISIKQGAIKQAVEISRKIPELEDPYSEIEYMKRLKDTDSLISIAYWQGEEAGFLVGYSINNSFYSWMGGVLPQFRRNHIAKELFQRQRNWAQRKGFDAINIKTRNKYKAMLSFLLSDGFIIQDLEKKELEMENRIHLKKILSHIN